MTASLGEIGRNDLPIPLASLARLSNPYQSACVSALARQACRSYSRGP